VTTFAERLVAVAIAEDTLGVHEVGSNRGARVEEYQRTVGLPAGAPWCAAFVAWCAACAAGTDKPPRWCSGSAITSWHKATRKAAVVRTTPMDADYLDRVRAGMVWVRAKDAAGAKAARAGTWLQGHIGIVVAVDEVGWHTVEGNTNLAGSREGDGVYRKTHKWSNAAQLARTIGWFEPPAV